MMNSDGSEAAYDQSRLLLAEDMRSPEPSNDLGSRPAVRRRFAADALQLAAAAPFG